MTGTRPNPEDHKPASRAGQAIILMSTAVTSAIGVLALSELQGVIRPFIIAIFLCFLIKPLTAKLSRRAGIFGYAFAFAFLFGLFSIAEGVISNDLASFSKNNEGHYQKNIASFQKNIDEYLEGHEALVDFLSWDKIDPIADRNKTPGEKIIPRERLEELANPAMISRILGTGASFFFGVFGEMLVVLVMMMLLLLESDKLPARLKQVYGDEKAEGILDVFREVGLSVTRYVSLKVWISLLTAISGIAVMWAFGLHYAVTFGIIIFVFNFVPYLGSVIATLFPCFIALLQFSPITALWLGVSLTIAQQVIGNFVEPRVVGKGLAISPVVVVLSLGFWGWLWGIGGMILAVPITVTLRIILEHFETTRQFALMIGGDE